MEEHVDVLIIGAGISGIGVAHNVKTNTNKSFRILEGRESFGGTWDLFKYPGIRSDSDMYSFTYDFHPWKKEQRFGSAAEIKEYLRDVLDTYDLEKYINYGQKVMTADFSSPENRWTLRTTDGKTFTSTYVVFASGYYDYDEGYTPDFKGFNDFSGKIIHPQKWPADYDITGKKVVVIGSGATAVTVVPAICDKAEVTMLQRSPTYMMPMPDKEPYFFLTRILIKIFGKPMLALLCRAFPKAMSGLYLKLLSLYMDKEQMKNFTPKYNLWDQRVCACPDADFHKMVKKKKAKIVTDHIDRFTPTGIALESGDNLECDVIVTATGLKLCAAGKVKVSIDGNVLNFTDLYYYRGLMFSGVPNLLYVFGYTNASWTLKVDIVNRYMRRLFGYLDERGYTYFVPNVPDDSSTLSNDSLLEMTSGYIERSKDILPKQGNRAPFLLGQDYYKDSFTYTFADMSLEMKFK